MLKKTYSWLREMLTKYWPDLLLTIALLISALVSLRLCNNDFTNYCNGFLGNLLSDLIIVVLVGFYFTRYYESRNHPHPTLVINDEHEFLELSADQATEGGVVLKLSVFNKNRKVLQQGDGFYHIFIEKKLSPEMRTDTTGQAILDEKIELEDYVHIHGPNPGPCLQGSILFFMEIACKLHSDVRESRVYYFFNTEAGVFPKKLKTTPPIAKNLHTLGSFKIKFT